MKYGLLIYKDTDNIGDDIQSYAASQFLPRVDYVLDRENMMDFVSQDGRQVKVIMNAWYIHDKYKFCFSPYIYPLFISMHLKNFPYEDGLLIGDSYITNETQNFLKKYSPVGARDLNTKKLLDKLEITNYFSGCLTLTIKKFTDVKKSNYICAVNINNKELEILKSKTSKKIISINQDVDKGSLSKFTWEERKNKVIELLKLYQGAELVITTKLHCALPCLALETNVLVLYDKCFDDRMKTFKKYFNFIDRNKFADVDISKIKNTDLYLPIRNNLNKMATDFINKKVEVETYDNKTFQVAKKIYDEKISLLENNLNEIKRKYVKECKKTYNTEKKLKLIIDTLEKEKEIDYNNHKKIIRINA